VNVNFLKLLQMGLAYAFFSAASQGTKKALVKSRLSDASKSLIAFLVGLGFVAFVFWAYFMIARHI